MCAFCVCARMLRLTLEQKELCRSRLKLLSYLKRLETYEVTTIGRHSSGTIDLSDGNPLLTLRGVILRYRKAPQLQKDHLIKAVKIFFLGLISFDCLSMKCQQIVIQFTVSLLTQNMLKRQIIQMSSLQCQLNVSLIYLLFNPLI